MSRPPGSIWECAAGLKQGASSIVMATSRPVVAIVVPFRSQKEQDRAAQLRRFLGHMGPFLSAPLDVAARPQFCIVIMAQSDDRRKFNRGQLLNAGFREAQRLAGSALAAVILHDVDLLPSAGLLRFYCECPPRGRPTHLATPSAVEKYSHLGEGYGGEFLGGVTAISAADFEACHGFPNDYWGWGLEDDQLRLRAAKVGALSGGVR